MIKLLANKKPIDKVNIFRINNKELNQELIQAKGIMNNYLKDKPFNVDIFEYSDDIINVRGITPSRKQAFTIQVKKGEDTPFLRKIYKAIDTLNKSFELKKIR